MSTLSPGRPALHLATTILAVAGLACAGEKPAPKAPAVPPPAASPAAPVAVAEAPEDSSSTDPLHRLSWMLGPWEVRTAGAGSIEHWRRVGDAIHGIAFTIEGGRTSSFEVLTVSHKDGKLLYTAMPGGTRSVDFPASEVRADVAVFANPAHDFPQMLRYERAGDMLSAQASAPGAQTENIRWSLGPSERSPKLEKADRAFAAEVAKRGIKGWSKWFDPKLGSMWTSELVSGRKAIRAAVAPEFARRGYRLEWTPIASGMSVALDLGYTTGEWTATWMGEDGARTAPSCGSYVTIWRKQPDGGWRALFYRSWPGRCPADRPPPPTNPA